MTNFTYIEIAFRLSTNTSTGTAATSTIWRVSDFKNYLNSANHFVGGLNMKHSNGSYYTREVAYVSDTSIYVSGASPVASSGTASGTVLMPLYIYGLK